MRYSYYNPFAALSAFTGIYLFLIIGMAVLQILAWIWIFKKAGEGWWKVFIPVYGNYCQFRIANSVGIFFGIVGATVGYFLLTMLAMAGSGNIGQAGVFAVILVILYVIAMIVLFAIYFARLADAFGRSRGFAAGLFFLYPIFIMILAFGNAQYVNAGYSQPQKYDIESDDNEDW